MKYVPQMKDPKFKFYKLMEQNRERYDALVKEVLAPKKESSNSGNKVPFDTL